MRSADARPATAAPMPAPFRNDRLDNGVMEWLPVVAILSRVRRRQPDLSSAGRGPASSGEELMRTVNRRAFLGTLGASALTIVPRRVLGGPGYVAPSDV